MGSWVENRAMSHGSTISSSETSNHRFGLRVGPQQIGVVNFAFLILTVASQAATIMITWDLWQVRDAAVSVINLPWFGAPPQFDYGWLLLASLALTLISPKPLGFVSHLLILLIAISTDQLRCQPQIISVTVLMAACIFQSAKKLAIWFLIAMWLWAGIHKFLSPDWYGEATYYLLLQKQFQWGSFRLWDHHVAFAVIVAAAEVALGLIAWYRPKIGAPICFLAHVGIAAFLFAIDWNFSVLPWNFCTAIVGAWLLWSLFDTPRFVSFPISTAGRITVAILLLSPIGFYFGMVRHSLCHVLYSDNIPDAVITQYGGPKTCRAIMDLRVPFPKEPKAFIDFFALTGKPGEKLHIREYRRLLPNRFFEMSPQRTVIEISREQFFGHREDTVPGIAVDDRRKLFQLDKEFHIANIGLDDDDPALARILKRSEKEMVWAIKFSPTKNMEQSFELIDGLPNLEQIQLSGTNITDEQLRVVGGARRLRGIGLDDTNITDEGLRHLEGLPMLETIQAQRTKITDEAITRTLSR